MRYVLPILLLLLTVSCNYFENTTSEPLPEQPILSEVNHSVKEMWGNYTTAHPEFSSRELPEFWYFHDNKEDAERLLQLVTAGKKRAMSGLNVWFEDAHQPLAEKGTKHIVTDFDGKAHAIIEITKVDTLPFNQVSKEYAALDMGTYESALEKWKKAHWEFFKSALSESNREPTENMLVVCEYFKVIWPETPEAFPSQSIGLSITPDQYSATDLPDEVAVTMFNTKENNVTTGLRYSIERRTKNTWQSLTPDLYFDDIGFRLPPDGSKVFSINLLKDSITYKAGTYRVVKKYIKDDYQETKRKYVVFAEFEVD